MLNFKNTIKLPVLLLLFLNTLGNICTAGQPGSSNTTLQGVGLNQARGTMNSLDVLCQEDFYRRLLALAPQEMEDSSAWCRNGRDSKAALVAAWQEKMPRFTALVGEIERRVTGEIENIRTSEMSHDDESTLHDFAEESLYEIALKRLRDIGATADVRVLEFSQDRCVLGFKDRIRILIAQSLVRLEIQWQESSVFRSSRFCIDDTLEGTRLSIPPVHFGFDGCSIEIPDRILNGVTDLIFEEIKAVQQA